MKDNRLAAALVAVAVLFLAAGTWSFLHRGGGQPETLVRRIPTAANLPPPSEAGPEAAVPGSDPEDRDRLYQDPTVPDEALSFGQFMELLGGAAKKPAVALIAEEFKRDYSSDPRLKALYEEYKRNHPVEPGGAADFFRKVRELPGFQALLSKFSGHPAATAAAHVLTTTPGLQSFMAKQYAALVGNHDPVKEHAGAKAVDQLKVAAEWSRKMGSGQAPSAPLGSAVAVGLGGGSKGGDKQTTGPLLASASRGDLGASSGKPSPGGSASAGNRGPGSQASGMLNPKLDLIRETSSQTMDQVLKDWLAKYGLDPLVYLQDQTSGIWDLCFTRHELRKCKDACDNQPSQVTTTNRAVCALPGDPTFWETCLIALGGGTFENKNRCLQECREQAPCQVDPAWYHERCVKPLTFRPRRPIDPHCGTGAGGGQTGTAGQEAWECKANGNNGFASDTDGRCYTEKGVCCVGQAHWGNVCEPRSFQSKAACTCAEGVPMDKPRGPVPYPCGGSTEIPPICKDYGKQQMSSQQCTSKRIAYEQSGARMTCFMQGSACVCVDSLCNGRSPSWFK